MLCTTSILFLLVISGVVNALYNLGGMIAAPLWGLIADRLKIHRFLCTILGVIALLTTLCQPLLTVQWGEGECVNRRRV